MTRVADDDLRVSLVRQARNVGWRALTTGLTLALLATFVIA